MATMVNTHEAKTHLSRLLARVEAGEEIVIARDGKAIAKLVPVVEEPRIPRLGTARGKVWMSPDWELSEEEIALFTDAPLTTNGDE